MLHRQTIQKLISGHTVQDVLRRKSRFKAEVRALQTILHELGFDNQLNWQKYGADGDYGTGTARAVRAFAQRNNQSDERGSFVHGPN